MHTVAIIPSTVGFHWEEVFAAYQVFKEEGWRVHFYTINGRPPVVDPKSVEQHLLLSYFGLGLRPSYSPQSPLGQQLSKELAKALPIDDLVVDKFDAIYVPGGHGCLFDVNIDPTFQAKLGEAFNKDKYIGAVCHGSSALAFTRVNNVPIIKGKKVIGFLDVMDRMLIKLNLVDPTFLPLPYWNEEKLIEAGAQISMTDKTLALMNPAHYVVDLPFVTGVGPKAAQPVAMRLVRLTHESKENTK